MVIPIIMLQNQAINFIDLIESIFVILASIFAICGINAWRKETRWKRKYELAEEALANFYEAQRNIQDIRMPVRLVWFNKCDLKTNSETKARDAALNYHERIACNRTAYDRLETLKFRFRIVFGKEYEKHIIELGKIYGRLSLAVYERERIELEPVPDKEELKRQDKILFASPEQEDDPINNKLNEIIKDIENVCVDIIGKK